MKATKIFLFIFFVLAVQPSYCTAQGKIDGLVAAPYPGSAQETNPGVTDALERKAMDSRSRTYYTKDSMDKVKTYYTKLVGPLEEYDKSYVFNKAVIPSNEVYDIVTKRGGSIGEGDGNNATFAGVTMYGPPINGSANYSVVKVYESLEKAYALRFQEDDPTKLQKRLEDAELVQVKQKYEHLKTAYFLQTNQKRKDNMPGTFKVDEVLYDKYYTSAEETRQKELEEIQKKYTDAMTKMKYDEATKLGDQMMKYTQPQTKDDWNTALKCLQEMEKNAYTTMIIIDMHPSKWDLTQPKE
jgi:hypothetical protein